MRRITGLGVGFLQFLEHRAFAAIGLGPNPIEAPIEPFCERSQEGDIVVVGRVVGQRQKDAGVKALRGLMRSEEHTSELQSLMRISYAVFCLKKNNKAK